MMPSELKRRIAAGVAAGALAVAIPVVSWFEGRSNDAYLDPVGIPTICEGITKGVQLGQRKTDTECDALLLEELRSALSTVDSKVKVPMPDTRRAALASFVYNVGAGAFSSSTLVRKLNSGDVRGGCDELLRWVLADGKRLPGLVKRREAERELCLML